MASSILEAGQGHLFAGLKRSKERKQLVIVFLEQRIEFVIVAPCALEAESQKDVGGGFGYVRKNLGPLAFNIPLVPLIDPMPQVHGGD